MKPSPEATVCKRPERSSMGTKREDLVQSAETQHVYPEFMCSDRDIYREREVAAWGNKR